MRRPSRVVGAADLLREAVAAVLAKPTRLLITGSGTALGIAALVAIAGLTTTAATQIVSRLDGLAATEVVVAPAPPAAGQPQTNVLPWDAEARLSRLNGVVAAGTLTRLDAAGAVRTRPSPSSEALQVDLVSASPGLLDAVRGAMAAGRWFDAGHSARGDDVAVLGRAAAERLGVADVSRRPAVFVGDRAFTVIGVLGATAREPGLLDSLIVPDGTARAHLGTRAPGSVHVDTALGAARLIGSQAALALAPQAPAQLEVSMAPEPRAVRAGVAGDLRALFLLLGAVSLVVGGLGIANTTLVGVLERTSEIGLRRSLGAARRHVAVQFVAESTAVGAVGGVVGTCLGILVVVAVSAAKSWTPVLEPWAPAVGVAAGGVIGLLAGSYPAWRAAAIEPIAALRTEA
jgi:ABC-type antimicrobial peptide transport system permease subunit